MALQSSGAAQLTAAVLPMATRLLTEGALGPMNHSSPRPLPLPPSLPAGLLSVAALGAAMLLNTRWYVDHRSAVVAAVRISSAALLLVHAYTDPGEAAGSGAPGCSTEARWYGSRLRKQCCRTRRSVAAPLQA